MIYRLNLEHVFQPRLQFESLGSSVGAQIDSKLKNARFLKSLISSETEKLNASVFVTRFRSAQTRSLGKCVSLYL